jgi:hypothetical protein
MAGIAGKIEEGFGVLIAIAIGAMAFVLYEEFANAKGTVARLFNDLTKAFGGDGSTLDAMGYIKGIGESIRNFPDYVFGSNDDGSQYSGEQAAKMEKFATDYEADPAAVQNAVTEASQAMQDPGQSVETWIENNRVF